MISLLPVPCRPDTVSSSFLSESRPCEAFLGKYFLAEVAYLSWSWLHGFIQNSSISIPSSDTNLSEAVVVLTVAGAGDPVGLEDVAVVDGGLASFRRGCEQFGTSFSPAVEGGFLDRGPVAATQPGH